MATTEWVGIGYSLPANPSRARVYAWRSLKAMGAQVVRPGMAALPNTEQNLSLFEKLAQRIRELSGDVIIVEFNFTVKEDSENLRSRFKDATKQQYRTMLDECAVLLERLDSEQESSRRAALQQQLAKTVSRYKKSPLLSPRGQAAGELEQAAGELWGALRAMPAELRALLQWE